MASFLPDNLSPAATAHLAMIRDLLSTALELGSPPPDHHVDLDPVAYTAALAWASAVVHEMLAVHPVPSDPDPASRHRAYPGLMSAAPLTLEEFALYVGLLFEACSSACADRSAFAAALDAAVDDETRPFSGSAPSHSGLEPEAVLLAMYLRLWCTVHVAAAELGPDRTALVSETTLGVVLALLHPPAAPQGG